MRLVTGTKKDDLDKSVVDDAGEYVDDVEDGEGHQQVVEGGPHLWLPGRGNRDFLLVTSQMSLKPNVGNVRIQLRYPSQRKNDIFCSFFENLFHMRRLFSSSKFVLLEYRAG